MHPADSVTQVLTDTVSAALPVLAGIETAGVMVSIGPIEVIGEAGVLLVADGGRCEISRLEAGRFVSPTACPRALVTDCLTRLRAANLWKYDCVEVDGVADG